ncbi:MAG: choice-of-anchor D domain-containing protein, partial [Ignavibacteriales bacterium]
DGLAIDDFEIDLTPPAVLFSIDPSSLNFGNVTIGDSLTLPVTVENMGTTTNLDITSAVSSNPVFTFTPNSFPVSIAPGNSQVFNITFTPATAVLETGTIEFTHNAPGSPSSLSLSGTGEAQGQSGLLKFKTSVRDLLDGTQDNPDTIVLSAYSGKPLKALQFNILLGKTNGGLILRSVSRGDAIPISDFNFSYQIYPGNILPDGSSIDTVKVVILGNDSNEILPDPGDQDILIFSYDLVSVSGLSAQTFNGLDEVTGATSTPVVNANITAGADETINIFNGTLEGLLGDVNLDNNVNILDLLLMIDYILDKTDFDSTQFFKGDIAPWNSGDPLPTRDAVIDVLDLAVLQNIVLTGLYPDGAPVYKLSGNNLFFTHGELNKLTPGMDAKVTFYFTDKGISVSLESIKKVKGLQMELNELSSLIPEGSVITSVFDQAFYYQDNSFLRMISYDGQSNPVMPGEFIVAEIPFTVINPGDIVVEEVIIADENNNALEKVEIEVKLFSPEIPIDYDLSQNYPNPFNPNTSIHFEVPNDGFVSIKIYDMLGQKVTEIFSGDTKAGKYLLNWDGKDSNGNKVSSGSYIYRMTAGDFVSSKKMLLLK